VETHQKESKLNKTEKWITLADAAKKYGTNIQTIWMRCKSRGVPTRTGFVKKRVVKRFKTRFVAEEELDNLMQAWNKTYGHF